MFRPASLTQSSADEFVDVRAVVAIGFDVEGAEIVLKDVIGHAVAIVLVLFIVVLSALLRTPTNFSYLSTSNMGVCRRLTDVLLPSSCQQKIRRKRYHTVTYTIL